MMKKLLLSLLAAVGLASPVLAQPTGHEFAIPLAIDYDLDSITFIYPVTMGQTVGASAAGFRAEGVRNYPGNKSQIKIATVGASTTVTALTLGTSPFQALAVDDEILVTTVGNRVPDTRDSIEGGQTVWLRVVTRADADNITVNQAVDLTGGVSFHWRRFIALGTAATGSGWVPVRGFDRAAFNVKLNGTTDGAGINVRVECRDDNPGVDSNSQMVVVPSSTIAAAAIECGAGTITAADQSCVFTDALTAAGLGRHSFTFDPKSFYECRVGVRINTADDGADAVVETIRIDFIGYPAR